MSNIVNNANAVEEKVGVNRDQIEHRATWFALIYDEMVKAGIDAEPILRRAVRRTGQVHGERLLERTKLSAPIDCEKFKDAFFGEDEAALGPQTFNMQNIAADARNVYSHFHYCALLSAWQKLGFDDETCALLCDMAMDGDRGIAEEVGLDLDLSDTLAKGCDACRLHFHR